MTKLSSTARIVKAQMALDSAKSIMQLVASNTKDQLAEKVLWDGIKQIDAVLKEIEP